MTTPRLAPISPLGSASPQDKGLFAFRVVSAGRFRGRTYRSGDVILCRGEARPGDQVVLVARHGRPRLGWLQGTALWGDLGERCHPERWAPAGRLVAVIRGGHAGSHPDLPSPREAGPQGSQRRVLHRAGHAAITPPAGAPRPTPDSPQLSLFAAA